MNITQEDREAAAILWAAGGYDDPQIVVEAFARHRQSAMLRCGEIAEGVGVRSTAANATSNAIAISTAIRKEAEGKYQCGET